MNDESINDADEKEEFDNLRSKKSASSWGGTRFLPQEDGYATTTCENQWYCRELGLSTATISNVIHGKTKKVSDETVKRVQALQKLHELKENKTSETTIKLPVRLIERASTGKITEQIQLWRDFT